jgi:DNA-binding NarL/FixJ family response regulator
MLMFTGLVIDPQPTWHQVLKPALFQAFGKIPHAAHSVAAARDAFAQETFDYVVVDPSTDSEAQCVNMLLEARKLGQLAPFCSLLILSSNNSSSFVASCGDLSPDFFMVKPLKIAIFIRRLEEAIAKRGPLKAGFVEWSTRGATDAVRVHFETALRDAKSQGAQSQALRALAQLAQARNEMDWAKQTLDRLASVAPSPQTQLTQAQFMFDQGENEQALALVESTMAEHPMLLSGYDLLAEARYQSGDAAAGLAARLRGNQLNPLNATRSEILADEALSLGELELARQTLEFQVAKLPSRDPAKRMAALARVHLAREDVAASLATLQHAQKALTAKSQAPSMALALAATQAALASSNASLAEESFQMARDLVDAAEGPKPLLADAALCAYAMGDAELGDRWLARALARHSFSFAQFQAFKERAILLRVEERFERLVREAAQDRAEHAERCEQLRQAGLFGELAQELIEFAQHPDTAASGLLDALDSMALAAQHRQLNQAAGAVAQLLRQRALAQELPPLLKARLELAMTRLAPH